MPNPYSLDLRWRIVWSFICHRQSFADIGSFKVCERTVRRYINLFQRTGDVRVCKTRHGPLSVPGEFEQMLLILANPGIYLCEIPEEIMRMFGVCVYIYNLKNMGCTRAQHFKDQMRNVQSMADISLYDVSMLVWLDESGCDDHNYERKYGYSMCGIPPCDHTSGVIGRRPCVYIAQGNMNGERNS